MIFGRRLRKPELGMCIINRILAMNDDDWVAFMREKEPKFSWRSSGNFYKELQENFINGLEVGFGFMQEGPEFFTDNNNLSHEYLLLTNRPEVTSAFNAELASSTFNFAYEGKQVNLELPITPSSLIVITELMYPFPNVRGASPPKKPNLFRAVVIGYDPNRRYTSDPINYRLITAYISSPLGISANVYSRRLPLPSSLSQ